MTDIGEQDTSAPKALEPVPGPPAVPLDEGSIGSLRQARALAERYHMNLVDLAVTSVDPDAGRAVPLHVLEHVVAIPFAFDGSTLRVAVFTAATEGSTAKSLARGLQVAKWCAGTAQKLAQKNA